MSKLRNKERGRCTILWKLWNTSSDRCPQETPVQESVEEEPEVTPVQENVPAGSEETPVQESVKAEPEVTPVQQSVPVQPQQAFGQQPVQPTQFTGQNSGQQPANNKPARFPKGIIAIVAAGVAVIAAIIIFVCVGNNVTDYKKTAKQYVKAVAECEWNDAYSLITVSYTHLTLPTIA